MQVGYSIEKARKLFLCATFDLPMSSSLNLCYVILPSLPPNFLLLRRKLSFLRRAANHDLECVSDAIAFDRAYLFPNNISWHSQLFRLLKELMPSLDLGHVNFLLELEKIEACTNDMNLVCFYHVLSSPDKTLSFFRLFQDVEAAVSFRTFFSTLRETQQNTFLLFLSSGLRWRFFVSTPAKSPCPCCQNHFWSWEHFFSCLQMPVQISLTNFVDLTKRSDWTKIYDNVVSVILLWSSIFDQALLVRSCDVLREDLS